MLSLIIFNALFLRKGDLFLLDGELTESIRSAATTVCAVKSTEQNACRTGGDVCQPQGTTISSKWKRIEIQSLQVLGKVFVNLHGVKSKVFGHELVDHV